MQRARLIAPPLPKGVKGHIRLREWGIERSYKTIRGNEICTPALYEKSPISNRKFQILTSDLINLGYIN